MSAITTHLPTVPHKHSFWPLTVDALVLVGTLVGDQTKAPVTGLSSYIPTTLHLWINPTH